MVELVQTDRPPDWVRARPNPAQTCSGCVFVRAWWIQTRPQFCFDLGRPWSWPDLNLTSRDPDQPGSWPAMILSRSCPAIIPTSHNPDPPWSRPALIPASHDPDQPWSWSWPALILPSHDSDLFLPGACQWWLWCEFGRGCRYPDAFLMFCCPVKWECSPDWPATWFCQRRFVNAGPEWPATKFWCWIFNQERLPTLCACVALGLILRMECELTGGYLHFLLVSYWVQFG